MLQGRELILASNKFANESRKKSWGLLLSTLILFCLCYAGAIINVHIIAQIICSILAGLLIVRLFIIYHDYLHQAILQKSVLAKAIFTVYGLFILAPTSIWKRSHNYHHAHNSKLYTSSIGSFPIVTKEAYLASSKTERAIYLFIRHPLTIFFGYIFVFFWGFCARTLFKNTQKHADCFISIVFHFAIGATIYYFTGWQGLILGFLVPAFISSMMGAYLFYAQHNFPDAKFKPKESWSYEYAALQSSSYMKMNAIMRWFTGNIGYHHIHHINPRIPFYNLPKAFTQMEEFQNPRVTSLSPIDIYKCCRIKVWDSERQQMIGLKELR